MKKILVVVDMQNDFIDGHLGTPEAVGIVDNVCAKIREGEWDWIIRTMDSHTPGYFKTQEGQKLPIAHCMGGTTGWCSNEDVRNAIQEVVAAKADKDGYCRSTMEPKRSFGAPELLFRIINYVQEHGEENIELTLVGVCTDICVISNALLLKAHYPEMKIVVDASCCAGSSPLKHLEALDIMESCQIDVINKENYSVADYFYRNED